jgi:NAD(P)-dependent dehydrogenase (short-subunit alcohol dehydrogenase family)
MQEFLLYSKKNRIKSSIINIGSIVGENGFKELAGYASTKGALKSLTKSFAVEYAKENIRANMINPGFIKTSYYNDFKLNKKKLYNWTLKRTPMGRWGNTNEVVNLIEFLISDKSSYITGTTINVDGGWLSS